MFSRFIEGSKLREYTPSCIFMLARFARLFSVKSLPQSTNILPTSVTEFTDFGQETSVDKVTTGRAWKAVELRLKSDEDLNKLWYVMLKEESTLLGDKYLKKHKYTIPGLKPRLDNVKQTKARILTVLREREMVREKYWKILETEYVAKAEKHLDEQHAATKPPEPKKPKRVLTEEQIIKKQKRQEAKSMIPNWRSMENSERRKEIAKVYAQLAHKSKDKFVKELRYVGFMLKQSKANEASPNLEANE